MQCVSQACCLEGGPVLKEWEDNHFSEENDNIDSVCGFFFFFFFFMFF